MLTALVALLIALAVVAPVPVQAATDWTALTTHPTSDGTCSAPPVIAVISKQACSSSSPTCSVQSSVQCVEGPFAFPSSMSGKRYAVSAIYGQAGCAEADATLVTAVLLDACIKSGATSRKASTDGEGGLVQVTYSDNNCQSVQTTVTTTADQLNKCQGGIAKTFVSGVAGVASAGFASVAALVMTAMLTLF